MSISRFSSPLLSRRFLVGAGVAGAATLPLASLSSAMATGTTNDAVVAASSARQEATAELGKWKTWIIDAPDAFRPSAPGAPDADEIDEVIAALASPGPDVAAAIAKWRTRPATIPWTDLALAAFGEFRVNGMRQTRNLALLHAAMHDAAVASWDAQLAYDRPSPAATDDRIVPAAGVNVMEPSFPSQAAAVAGAASTVLAYLLPDAEPDRFTNLAEEAANAQVWAGAAFPSDIEAGLALGQAVGDMAVARGQSDGSDAIFDSATMPSGPEFWAPTPPGLAPPVEPLAGSWQTWILERADQLRPAPPPDLESAEWQSEMLAVQEAVATRTVSQTSDAMWWQSVYPRVFFDWSRELLVRHGLDTPHAARVLAYQSVSMADAMAAVWDGKYTWWTARPSMVDLDLNIAFPNPPYPAFPSGYSGTIGAYSQITGLFFPEDADDLEQLAWRAVRSRLWAGIHYPIDNEVAFTMGRCVGRLAAIRAREEGAFPA